MKKLQRFKKVSGHIKDISLTLTLIASLIGVTFSYNANATSANNIESTVSEFVITQGKRMMTELNVQLEQSIKQETQAVFIKYFLKEISSAESDAKLIAVNEMTENHIPNKVNN